MPLLRRTIGPCLLSLWYAAAGEHLDARQQTIPPGDSSLSGRVTEGNSGPPLQGVTVTLMLINSWAAPLTTVTNEEGRYEFTGIRAGSYRVTPRLPGFGVQQQPRDINPLNGVIELPPRHHLKGLDFPLARGGIVSGQVTDQAGHPISGATVSAEISNGLVSFRIGSGHGASRTDEQGFYTIRDLGEGMYLLSVTAAPPRSKSSRGVTTMRQAFFPGTTEAKEATLVKVGGGEAVRGLNIIVPDRRLLRITGQVLGAIEGRPGGGLLTTGNSIRTVDFSDDGAFEVSDLAPGRYTMWARSTNKLEAGILVIDAVADMSEMMLPMMPTTTIAGRLVTGDGAPLPSQQLEIAAVLASEGKRIDPLDRDRTEIASDGTFELSGLFGERVIHVIGLDVAWSVDRVLQGKRTVQLISLSPAADVRDLTVVLRRQ